MYLCYKRAGPGDEGVLPLGDIRIIDTDEVPGKAEEGGCRAAMLPCCLWCSGAVVQWCCGAVLAFFATRTHPFALAITA